MNEVADTFDDATSMSGSSLGIKRITIQPLHSRAMNNERKRQCEEQGRREIEQWDVDHPVDPLKRIRSDNGGIGGSIGSIGKRFEMLKMGGQFMTDLGAVQDEEEDEGDGTFLRLQQEISPSGKIRTVARDKRLPHDDSQANCLTERDHSMMSIPSIIANAQVSRLLFSFS